MAFMTRAVSALAGVRRDAMDRAPQALNQSATTGFLMVLTSIIASFTMGYALHRAFEGDRFQMWVTFVGGPLWGLFVLALDRLLILGLDKNARWYQSLLQLGLRLPIAIVLGVAISKPLILRLSQSVLDLNLRETERATVARERNDAATDVNLPGKQADVKSLESAIATQEQRVLGTPDSFEYSTAKSELAASVRRLRETENRDNPRIAAAWRQIAILERSTAEADHNRASVHRGNIGRWHDEISRAGQEARTAERNVEEIGRQWLAAEKDKLDELKRRYAAAGIAATEAGQVVDHREITSGQQLSKLMSPNLVNEYTTLKRVEAMPNHPDARTLATFELSLDLLFILFELTPLLSKMLTRANALDHAITAIEFEDENRINHESNVRLDRLEKIIDVSRTVNDEALEQWAEAKLDLIRQHHNVTPKVLSDLRAEIAEMTV